MYKWFTEEELKALSTKQLKTIADYFNVKYTVPIRRKKLIPAILQLWEGSDEPSGTMVMPTGETVQVSVQVQRIYDDLKEKKDGN